MGSAANYTATAAAVLALLACIVGAFLLWRGGSGTAVTGLQTTNRELERQIRERDGKISTLERINAELRAEKDVAVAIAPVLETLKAHEERAQERHEHALVVLDLIAKRLGPDPNGGTQ